MSFFRSPSSIKALFGEKGFRALQDALNLCCGSGCCPSEKYVLSYTYNGCSGNRGLYTISVTPLQNISGVVNLGVYINTSGTWGSSNAITVQSTGVTAGESIILITNTMINSNIPIEIVVIDSIGNYSNVVSFISTICP